MPATICDSPRDYLVALGEVLARIDGDAIEALTQRLFDAWENDQLVLVFGNGGSAYTASHFVTDMVKTAAIEGQRRLRAISLVDNYGLTTALGNDISYEQTFVYPLQSYARPGDLAIAISASGNSPNVLAACRWAKDNGLTLACLTGFTGGRIAPLADVHVHVPSDNYGVVEDLHLSVGHMATQALRSSIAAAANARTGSTV